MIGFSLLNAEFIKNGNIVSDSVSGLQWQDDSGGSKMKWEDAVSQCESLTLGEYSNWRLPNVNELKSIVDRSKYAPAIVNGFENTGLDYWSSTTYEPRKGYAWIVDFWAGHVGNNNKGNDDYVRCVRDGE